MSYSGRKGLQIGEEFVQRKHGYLSCAWFDRLQAGVSPEEEARMYKESAFWSTQITAAEWKVVLGESTNAPVRSKLKRKGAGMLVALVHLATINPELFAAMCELARETHQQQMEHEFPWEDVVPALCGLPVAEPGQSVQVKIIRKPNDEKDEVQS